MWRSELPNENCWHFCGSWFSFFTSVIRSRKSALCSLMETLQEYCSITVQSSSARSFSFIELVLQLVLYDESTFEFLAKINLEYMTYNPQQVKDCSTCITNSVNMNIISFYEAYVKERLLSIILFESLGYHWVRNALFWCRVHSATNALFYFKNTLKFILK